MQDILILLSKYFYYKPVDLRKILEGFSDLRQVMEAPKDAFLKLGVGSSTVLSSTLRDEPSGSDSNESSLPKGGKALDDFLEHRNANDKFPMPWRIGHANYDANDHANAANIKIVTILDANYPAALKNIYDPPPILFYKGDLTCLTEFVAVATNSVKPLLAVIGSRKISEYGRRACEMLVKDLCPHFVIVSGLAYGVDGLSHEITVKNKQKTIGVLGSGLDEASIYPKSNINLAKKIIDCGGLLLSEIPPGMSAQKFHFPMRNRIIAGISGGVLIIEGGQKSGTLITAKLGLEYGADIFCVPGSIFNPNSEGVNYLIKNGAHPITEARDILEFYGINIEETKKEYAPKNQAEKSILENLGGEGRQTDELARLTGMAIIDLMGTLTDLEMEGAVKNINGKYVKI